MNESELETELLRLSPRAPSAELEERIAAAMPGALVPLNHHVLRAAIIPRGPATVDLPTWRHFWPNLVCTVAGAAAAVAVVLAFQANMPSKPSAEVASAAPAAAEEEIESLFEAEDAASEVVSADEPEILFDDEAEPTQLVRYSSLERYTWTNRATGARIEVEMPREDVLLVPLAYQ